MDIWYCRMDALTLSVFLSPILTVTIVWNTEETGDINIMKLSYYYSQSKYKLIVYVGATRFSSFQVFKKSVIKHKIIPPLK